MGLSSLNSEMKSRPADAKFQFILKDLSWHTLCFL